MAEMEDDSELQRSNIGLVDNTMPHDVQDDPTQARSRLSRHLLTKKLSKESRVRKKYSKYQADRYSSYEDGGGQALSQSQSLNRQSSTQPATDPLTSEPSRRSGDEVPDFEADELPPPDSEPQSVWELDILYENQRGFWFFGLPLFSSETLMNLDPPAWATRDLDESPVNITNAQVPDPSWEWAWKTWYIDMSYDVDEEGWQYSFSFASRFSWHGTHPWMHSFVRRRRWLRMRVKKGAASLLKTRGILQRSHLLSERYFTVHCAAASRNYEPSLGPYSREGSISSRTSFHEYLDEVLPQDITNVSMLMMVMKRATIDREKIDAVKRLIRNTEEGLSYLPERISDIMSVLIFQTSRRQLRDMLQQALEEIPDDTSDPMEQEKRANLQKSIKLINDHVMGLSFWGQTVDAGQIVDRKGKSRQVEASFGDEENGGGVAGNIKGIPERAHVGMNEGHIHRGPL